MLISEYVEIGLCPVNINHFEELGYDIPKKIGKTGELVFTKGTKILVRVEHLLKSSKTIIECKCDNCGKTTRLTYADYLRYVKKSGETYCNYCATIMFSIESIRKSRLLNKNNSFENFCLENGHEDILERWDYELNTFSPSEISQYSRKKVYLKCPIGKHYSEIKEICNFSSGNHDRILDCNACNSVAELYPESLTVWSNLNIKSPFESLSFSKNVAWFKCENNIHEDYKRTLTLSVQCEFRCPKCSELAKDSILSNKVKNYLLKYYNILTEYDCTLITINPKTNRKMPFDVEIPDLKLIIEVHGYQHYIKEGYTYKNAIKKGVTPDEILEYQQWRDAYKKQYALSQGFCYLEIPYWTDNKTEDWKILINNKINEILNNN